MTVTGDDEPTPAPAPPSGPPASGPAGKPPTGVPFPRASALVGMALKVTGGIAALLVAATTFSLAACGTGGIGDLVGSVAGGALPGIGANPSGGDAVAADPVTAADIRDFVLAADKLECTPESIHRDTVADLETYRTRVLNLEADRETLALAVRRKADAVATIPDTVTTVGGMVDIVIADLLTAQDRADVAETALADIQAAMARAAAPAGDPAPSPDGGK